MSLEEKLFEEVHRPLRAFIAARVGDKDTVEDILQETFVRLQVGISRVRDQSRVVAWVFQVTRNVIADHYRTLDKRRETLIGPEVEFARSDLIEEPENYNQEMAECLAGMVLGLPEIYREAIQLSELEGLTKQEVALRLGLSLSGAKSRVQRGRQLLKASLLECCRLDVDRLGNIIDAQAHEPCDDC